jgi:hypothetical protein
MTINNKWVCREKKKIYNCAATWKRLGVPATDSSSCKLERKGTVATSEHHTGWRSRHLAPTIKRPVVDRQQRCSQGKLFILVEDLVTDWTGRQAP